MNKTAIGIVLLLLGGIAIYTAYKGNYKAVAKAIATGSFSQGAATDGNTATPTSGGTGAGTSAGSNAGNLASTPVPANLSPVSDPTAPDLRPWNEATNNGTATDGLYAYDVPILNDNGQATCGYGWQLVWYNGAKVCRVIPEGSGDVSIKSTGIFA